MRSKFVLPARIVGIVLVISAGLVKTEALGSDDTIDRVTAARAIPTSNKKPMTPIEALQAFQLERHIKSGTEFFKDASYVGVKACAVCHKEQYAEWKHTWHAKMEQWPTKDVVIGEFDGNPITYKNIKVTSTDGKRREKVTFQIKPFQEDGGYYFTIIDKDNAANNQTFKIEKTLGGKWDQGYEILVGQNYYPAPLRYSNTGGGWLVKSFHPHFWIEADGTSDGRPRRPEELPKHRVAEAKCAGCHTTGFGYQKDKETGLWQTTGNGQLGVGCEKCHGPGSRHIELADAAKVAGRTLEPGKMGIVHGLKDLDFQQQNQLCAQCHGRGTNRQNKEIAFPLGYLPGDLTMTEKMVFWNFQSTANPKQAKYFYRNNWAKRNREQWQDHQLSKHYTKAGLSCLTCHTVHGKWKNMQLRVDPQAMCTGCHTSQRHAARPQSEMFKGSKMEDADVTCINCHMARIGYRSHLTAKTENAKDYPMDGSAHHYLVPTPAIKKAYGVRTACEVCHTKGRAMPPSVGSWAMQHPMTDDQLDAKLKQIQGGTRTLVDLVRTGLSEIKADANGDALRQARVEKARSNLNFVLLDGSMGFHNPKKAKAKLVEALALLDGSGGPIGSTLGGAPQKPREQVAGYASRSSGAVPAGLKNKKIAAAPKVRTKQAPVLVAKAPKVDVLKKRAKVQERASVEKTAMVEKPVPVKPVAAVKKAAPAKKAGPVKKAAPVRQAAPVEKAKVVRKAAPVKKVEPVKQAAEVQKLANATQVVNAAQIPQAVTLAAVNPAPLSQPDPPQIPPSKTPSSNSQAAALSEPEIIGQTVTEPLEGNWYISRNGDTLSLLAQKIYGQASEYPIIFKANGRVLTADPNLLVPGTRLWLPIR